MLPVSVEKLYEPMLTHDIVSTDSNAVRTKAIPRNRGRTATITACYTKIPQVGMGGLWSLFGGEEEADSNVISQHDKVILELKSQRDNLTRYTKKVQFNFALPTLDNCSD
jgi:hypothetical protein